MTLTRRRVLALAAGAAAIPALGALAGRAYAADGDAADTIAAFAGGREPQPGRITLTAPETAENGNAVPITIEVDSAMADGDMVDSVLLLADGNPRLEVATFRFTAMSGVAAVSTRIRLARSQNVIALARMTDGSVHVDRKEVTVTVGGCGG